MKRSTAALTLLLAAFGAACVVAAVKGNERGTARADARVALLSLSKTLAASREVLARRRTWPDGGYDGLALSVDVRDAPGGRLAYDVVARVSDEPSCVGAIEGGRDLAEEILVGPHVLTAAALAPMRQARVTAEPAETLCDRREFPLDLRFRHVVELAPGP